MKINSPLAVWSLVLGILAIISCGPFTGIPAIICGHMARARIKLEPDKLTGEGMALAGLIMGYFSIIALIIIFIIGIVVAIAIPSIINLQQNATPTACLISGILFQIA